MTSELTLLQLRENVDMIREKMARAALHAGRRPEDILLCAACKARSSELVRFSADTCIDVFGENRMQEMRRHLEDGAFQGKPCHFIGHLQTNKVRQVVGQAELIHSVGSGRLLAAINREAGRQGIVQDILIEINLGLEDSKAGIREDELKQMLEAAEGLKHVRVRGLMAIPPPMPGNEEARPFFARLRELMEQAQAWQLPGAKLDTLSMGMSGSYEAAIMEGATIVRVGRDIYGERG